MIKLLAVFETESYFEKIAFLLYLSFLTKQADVLKSPACFCLYCQNLIISLDIVGIMVYYIAIVIHTIQL